MSLTAFSQNQKIVFFGDTCAHIDTISRYIGAFERKEMFVYTSIRERNCGDTVTTSPWCVELKVFEDSTMKYLIYETYNRNDSTFFINYWPNGKAKYVEIFKHDPEYGCGLAQFAAQLIYCEDGLLVFEKRNMDNQIPWNLKSFYCNGQEAVSLTTIGSPFDISVGELTKWWPNGKLCLEGFYNKQGFKEGEFRYYNRRGKLYKIETYEGTDYDPKSVKKIWWRKQLV